MVEKSCLETAARIEKDKEDAEKDLQAALPALERAEKAVNSIQ